MTIYFEAAGDGGIRPDDNIIVENAPEYVEIDENGRLIITIEEMPSPEKIRQLVHCAESAIETSDEFDLVEPAKIDRTSREEG